MYLILLVPAIKIIHKILGTFSESRINRFLDIIITIMYIMLVLCLPTNDYNIYNDITRIVSHKYTYTFTVDKNVSRAFFLYPELLLVYKLKVIPFV